MSENSGVGLHRFHYIPILKYMTVFHFLKSMSNDVTDVYFKWRHTC